MDKKKKTKKKSPSRIKYETSHPTVSARIPIAVKAKIIANLKKLNMNTADAFKELARVLEEKVKPTELTHKAENSVGISLTMKYYAVSYKCSKCGQTKVINTPEEKEAASKLMTDAGWKHETCPEPHLPQTTPAKPVPANMRRPKPNQPAVPADKPNGNQDKIVNFLRDQPSMEHIFNSNQNKKNPAGS